MDFNGLGIDLDGLGRHLNGLGIDLDALRVEVNGVAGSAEAVSTVPGPQSCLSALVGAKYKPNG